MMARSALSAGMRRSIHAVHVTSARGALLPAPERRHLENRFRHDFAHVRVHENQDAQQSAAALDTDAYTLGHHIVFRSGGGPLHDPRRRSLLEHEALHTLQAAPVNAQATPRVAESGDAAERGASMAAKDGVVRPDRVATPTILRAPPSGQLDLGGSLAERADPMMARVVGAGAINNFALGKAELTPGHHAALKHLAARLLTLIGRFHGCRIHVTGYTDALGGEERNDALGLERANAVKQEFAGFGLPVEAIDVESKGKNELLVPSKTAEPRNRRVAIQFEPTTGLRMPSTGAHDKPTGSVPIPVKPDDKSGGGSPSAPYLIPDRTPKKPAKDPADKSPYDALNDQIDHDIRGLQPHLPKWLFDQVKNGTHAAAKGLITKILQGAIDIGPLPAQVRAVLSRLLDLLEKKPSDFTKGPDPENRGSPFNPQNWDMGPKHDLPSTPGVLQLPPLRF